MSFSPPLRVEDVVAGEVARRTSDEVLILRQPPEPGREDEVAAFAVERQLLAAPGAEPQELPAPGAEALSSIGGAFADATVYDPLAGPPGPLRQHAWGFGKPGNHRLIRGAAEESPHSISSGTRHIQPHHAPTDPTVRRSFTMAEIRDMIAPRPSLSAIEFRLGKRPCACADAMRNIRPRTVASAALSAACIEALRMDLEREAIIQTAGPALDAPVCACGRIGPDFFLQYSNWVSGQSQPLNIISRKEEHCRILSSLRSGFVARARAEIDSKRSYYAKALYAAEEGPRRTIAERPLDARDQGGTIELDPPLRGSTSYIPINGESNVLRRVIGTPLARIRDRAARILGPGAVLPDSALHTPGFVDATVAHHLPPPSDAAPDPDRLAMATSTAYTASQQRGIPDSWDATKRQLGKRRRIVGTASDGLFLPHVADSHPRVTKLNTWAEPDANTVARRRRLGVAIGLDDYDTSFAQ